MQKVENRDAERSFGDKMIDAIADHPKTTAAVLALLLSVGPIAGLEHLRNVLNDANEKMQQTNQQNTSVDQEAAKSGIRF